MRHPMVTFSTLEPGLAIINCPITNIIMGHNSFHRVVSLSSTTTGLGTGMGGSEPKLTQFIEREN